MPTFRFTPRSEALATMRLAVLLAADDSSLGGATIAAARALGSASAGQIVAALIEAELGSPSAERSPGLAARLARELRLTGAVPALVHCLERLSETAPLAHAALAALERMGPDALDALLAAFDRCTGPEERAKIACALSRTRVEDERVRRAFARMLEDDPLRGAQYLAGQGDPRALPDLAAALDRVEVKSLERVRAESPDAFAPNEDVIALATAIRELGGALSASQRAKLEQVLRLQDQFWFEEGLLPNPAIGVEPAPARRAPRPGRNDPCHCGSGKKYKRCHLEADERDGRATDGG